MTTRQKITVQNNLRECEALTAFLSDFFAQHALPESIFNDIKLALEEAFTNIVNHAYDDTQAHEIHIELTQAANTMTLALSDKGKAFNPLSDAPAFNKQADHCDGGMGIHLIRSLTDEQSYRRVGEYNVFTLTKHYT
ncbi:MAG TPA: ATP-binding protein [Thiotrichales bacterium]|nr:ATP-binding protein [Thiotrichales bacterium]